MKNSFNIKFENGIRFLTQHFQPSDESSIKPRLFLSIRVGIYLYHHEYTEDIILGGLLHDTLEWSHTTEKMIQDNYGKKVLKLILANTKNDHIEDKYLKTSELIQRCVKTGQDALIIKTADILDSFKWYASQDNIEQLKYCMRNANAIFKYKKNNFQDPIFDELSIWKQKFEYLTLS